MVGSGFYEATGTYETLLYGSEPVFIIKRNASGALIKWVHYKWFMYEENDIPKETDTTAAVHS
jgi:hypothetical protein